jgi:hypothetical protein
MGLLHDVPAQYETDSSSVIGLPSAVDRLSTGSEKLNNSGADRF